MILHFLLLLLCIPRSDAQTTDSGTVNADCGRIEIPKSGTYEFSYSTHWQFTVWIRVLEEASKGSKEDTTVNSGVDATGANYVEKGRFKEQCNIHNTLYAAYSQRNFDGYSSTGGYSSKGLGSASAKGTQELVLLTDYVALGNSGNFNLTINDCEGNPVYYITQQDYTFGSIDVDLRVCRDKECKEIIGYSKKSEVSSVQIKLYAGNGDNTLANYSVKFNFDQSDAPVWHAQVFPINSYVYGVSPEITDPRIISAIATERMNRDENHGDGFCNTWIFLWILFGCFVGLLCLCCMLLVARAM